MNTKSPEIIPPQTVSEQLPVSFAAVSQEQLGHIENNNGEAVTVPPNIRSALGVVALSGPEIVYVVGAGENSKPEFYVGNKEDVGTHIKDDAAIREQYENNIAEASSQNRLEQSPEEPTDTVEDENNPSDREGISDAVAKDVQEIIDDAENKLKVFRSASENNINQILPLARQSFQDLEGLLYSLNDSGEGYRIDPSQKDNLVMLLSQLNSFIQSDNELFDSTRNGMANQSESSLQEVLSKNTNNSFSEDDLKLIEVVRRSIDESTNPAYLKYQLPDNFLTMVNTLANSDVSEYSGNDLIRRYVIDLKDTAEEIINKYMAKANSLQYASLEGRIIIGGQ